MEGRKVSMSVAQVKELLPIFFELLGDHIYKNGTQGVKDVADAINRYSKNRKRGRR